MVFPFSLRALFLLFCFLVFYLTIVTVITSDTTTVDKYDYSVSCIMPVTTRSTFEWQL